MTCVIRIADVACGAGMASLGVCSRLAALGLDPRVVAAVDPWTPAVDSYRANLAPFLASPDVVRQTTAEEASPLPYVDLLLTGPPCVRDSTLTKAHRRTDRIAELAGTKAAAHVIGEESARIVVMETVGNQWVEWGRARGYQAVRLQDSACGGFTLRRRTFLVKGVPYPLSPPENLEPRGWGEALPQYARGFVMANDADREEKRRKYGGIPPHLPGYAVVGHGTAHRLYTPDPWAYVRRLTPEEHAALSGFPGLALLSPRTRERQTLIGNGWPRSFGAWLASALRPALEGM